MTGTETAPSLIVLCRPRKAEMPVVRWDGSEGVFAILKLWGAEPARWTAVPPGGVMVWGAASDCAVASPGDWLVRDRRGAARYTPEEFADRFEIPAAPGIASAGTGFIDVGLLLAKAQEDIAFQTERAEKAEAAAAEFAAMPGMPARGLPGAVPAVTRTAAGDLDNGLPVAWSNAVFPGGYVCAVPDSGTPDGICGVPVESEPCGQHGEAGGA